ncbi:phage tail protein [Streptomyces sp. NPDC090442]|uniref:phage tail protein n=1 Tax=Streptomyces sp. NPDC090442 TaxID=3365962 RepID=UPI00381573DE
MTRPTVSSHRRMAAAATAALLSLGLLTACGSGASGTDASSASSSQKAESRAHASDNGAQGHADQTSPAYGAKLNLQEGDALSAHTFQLSVNGGTEALGEVSALNVDQPTEQFPSNRHIPGGQESGTVTVIRGAERSRQFTDLIEGGTQPETASLSQLDAAGNPTKQYTLQEPRVIKVENPPSGNAQSVTIKFTNLTVG